MSKHLSPPNGWPKDRPLALSVSVMLEGWTDDHASILPAVQWGNFLGRN